MRSGFRRIKNSASLQQNSRKTISDNLPIPIIGSINLCHAAIADARVMHSVIIANGSDMATMADMPPKVMVTAVMAVVIAIVVRTIFIVSVAMITLVIS